MNPRAIIAQIAKRYVGVREQRRNWSPEIDAFWKATNYPDGAADAQPWCAAFVCFVLREADRESKLLRFTPPAVTPAVANWPGWAVRSGCVTFHATKGGVWRPECGDIVVYLPRLSHIGIVESATQWVVSTIEGNTNAAGSREGDGVYEKKRVIDPTWTFIRVPAVALPVRLA